MMAKTARRLWRSLFVIVMVRKFRVLKSRISNTECFKSPFVKGGFRQQCPVRKLHVMSSKYIERNFSRRRLFT